MVTKTFGDILFSPGSECLKEFPSPESLKKRIIISTKPPKEYLEAKEIKDKQNDLERGKASDEEAWGKEVPDLKGTVADYKVSGDAECDLLLQIDIISCLLVTCCLLSYDRMTWMKKMRKILRMEISHSIL